MVGSVLTGEQSGSRTLSMLMLRTPDYAQYGFDTAWSPPETLIEKVSVDWPTLTFRLEYEEPGMNFAGCCTNIIMANLSLQKKENVTTKKRRSNGSPRLYLLYAEEDQ